jgi:polyhydroxybutyrate depolymerase
VQRDRVTGRSCRYLFDIRYFTAFLLSVGLCACASSSTTSGGATTTGGSTAVATQPTPTSTGDSAATTSGAAPTSGPLATAVPTSGAPVASDPANTDPASTDPAKTVAPKEQPADTSGLLADRPFSVFTPSTYAKGTPTPLVVLLHGYTVTGAIQEAYFKLEPLAEERGFLYVHPDGTKDALGNGFWDATDGCCDFLNTPVDDSKYLAALVADVQKNYSVDPKRIYFIGHSNGGFMSFRMACDHADLVAGIVSVAGATFADTSKCAPSEPVAIMSIHGTADATIKYDGGENFGRTYPSAATTMSTWATYNGCDTTPVESPTKVDLEANVAGAETTVSSFPGCAGGSAVELRTMDGAPHTPAITPQFFSDAIDFLFAHPKS